jgi:hypothetical protein
MKDSHLGFEYSWSDLKPVRALATVVFGAQILGALLGYLFPQTDRWIVNAWLGGAVATLPAFLFGLLVQARLTPGRLTEHAVLVRRLGLISALLFASAVAMWLLRATSK